jgi:hypothetical protein
MKVTKNSDETPRKTNNKINQHIKTQDSMNRKTTRVNSMSQTLERPGQF